METAQYLGIGIGLVLMLGTLNVFFITRLVKKLDYSADAVKDLQGELKHLSEKISEIKDLCNRIDKLEKDVVILQYVAHKYHPEACSRE